MIDIIKKDEKYFLTLGHDFISNAPKRMIPISQEEAIEFSNSFSEDFAIAIGNGDAQWSLNEFKLTDAPDHPYGWTDLKRKRTILQYQDQSWHMLASEIAEIGRLAKRVLSSNE
jgi:hypothetical protein